MATRSVTLPQKLYFRIGEVAELVGVEPHVLRYWEREFRTIRPTKSAKGQRVYSRRDVENLMRVKDLLYRERFTIAGARQKLGRIAPSPDPADGGHHEGTGAEPSREAVQEGDRPLAPERRDARPVGSDARPAGGDARPAERMRDDLLAIRADVRAFLDEIDLRPDR